MVSNRFKVSILFTVVLFLHQSVSAFDNHCEFYLQVDQTLGCSADPTDHQKYLVNYGYRLCKKYSEHQLSWDYPLQTFITRVAPCLQNKVAELMTTEITCTALGQKAFASHSACYRESGFCELSFSDKMKVFKVAFDLSLIRNGSWSLGYQLLKQCP